MLHLDLGTVLAKGEKYIRNCVSQNNGEILKVQKEAQIPTEGKSSSLAHVLSKSP